MISFDKPLLKLYEKGSEFGDRASTNRIGTPGGGYVPPGTPNWHPVLEKFSPKIDTPL